MTLTPQQPTAPTGPHTVHFSHVKEAVESESGRFEFLKQMLTVGLAGIAGLAAIFTDQGKIPDQLLTRATLVGFALSAVALVIASALGISAYANYLRDVNRLSNDPGNAELLEDCANSTGGILRYARISLIAAGLAAFALIAFSFLQLRSRPLGAEAAMNKARQIIIEQPGQPEPIGLDHFQSAGSDYLITYVTDPGKIKYMVRVDRNTNDVLEVTKPQ
jgi:hypothetical protein